MTEHKDIQDPKKYSKKDYEKFEYQLFAEDEKEDIKYRIIAIKELMKLDENHLVKTKKDIAVQEKINENIKESIKTERYKNLEPGDISDFHYL